MIPRSAQEFRQDHAHLWRVRRQSFRAVCFAASVQHEADGSEQSFGIRRLNRYPSPSLWSGPLWVRPALFPRQAARLKNRRQVADSMEKIAPDLVWMHADCLGAARGSKQTGKQPCGSEFSRRRASLHLRWPDAAKPLPNRHFWVVPQVRAPQRYLAETPCLAGWWVPPATSPIATNTQSVADAHLNRLSGRPDASDIAALVRDRGGDFILPVPPLVPLRIRRDDICSGKS